MHPRHPRRLITQGSVVALTILSLGLAACGAASSGSTGNKNLIIASELPVSGTDAGDGLPTQHGVELAVSQANLGHGYTLTFEGKDDVSTTTGTHDAAVGASNITALAADPKVMAVVGPFNSGVAGSEIPVANNAGLVLISPSNTNPGLTLQQYSSAYGFVYSVLHPAGRKDYYFRIPGNDISQGAIDATISRNLTQAGGPTVNKAFVVDDNSPYGKGLADQFSKSFTSDGGTLVGSRASIQATQTASFSSVASSIVAAAPDLIFYGGTTGDGGPALKQATDAAYVQAGKTPVIWEGGDGIADDSAWLTSAGASAVNTIGTVAAPDVATLGKSSTAASTFISDYTAKYGSAPIPYSAIAYDAANIEIQAIKNLINAGKPVTRDAVRDEIAGIQYTGVTGAISFDANGDNSGTKVFSVWACQSVGGKPTWVFEQDVNA